LADGHRAAGIALSERALVLHRAKCVVLRSLCVRSRGSVRPRALRTKRLRVRQGSWLRYSRGGLPGLVGHPAPSSGACMGPDGGSWQARWLNCYRATSIAARGPAGLVMLSTPVSIVSALVARRTASQSGLPGRDPRDVAGGRPVGLSTPLAFAGLAAAGAGSRFGPRPPPATPRAAAPGGIA